MFLLDTNAVSESRKLATSNVDPVFKNWIDEIDPNLLYVSVISLMELSASHAEILGRVSCSENGLIWKSNRITRGECSISLLILPIPARV